MIKKLLTMSEINARLAELPGWQQDGDEILWHYRAPSFAAAMLLVSAVAHLAEQANHHPAIMVEYRDVQLCLSTHSAGGLTDKDFELAAQISRLVAQPVCT